MSLRDDLLPILDKVARTLPDTLGFRGESLTIRTRTWSGGIVGQGTSSDTDLVISPRPKMRESPDARAMIIEGITPHYEAGGYTPAQLDPRDGLAAGQEVLWIVTGDFGTREYTTAYLDATKSTRYTLHLSGLNRADPY